jgi:hypothetical protein
MTDASSADDRRLWFRWTAANALGEFLGLGFVFGAGWLVVALVGPLDTPRVTVLTALLAIGLGAFEGAVVGMAQARVLATRLTTLEGWVRGTVYGAMVAWAVGMLPSTIMSLQPHGPTPSPAPEISDLLQLLMAACLGLAAGPILAAFQVRALRRHVRKAWLWLPANALAWAIGMPVIFAGIHAAYRAPAGAAAVVVVLLTLGTAGAAVGAIHGIFLLRLLRPENRRLT